jgi:NitT/TauT family transport system permease protein
MNSSQSNRSQWTLQTLRWGLLLLVVLFWQWIGGYSPKTHFFYSTPLAVISRLFQELTTGTLLADAAATCEEVFFGFLLGVLVGSAIGLVLWWFVILGRAVRPFIIALASIPVFAVAPLLVLWFGVGLVGKIMVVALSVVFICLLATYQAAEQIEIDFWEVAACVHASRLELFNRVVLKGSIILASPSYRLAMIFGFIGAFLAELISSSKGLGHFIQRSAGLYDVPGLFAGLTVFIVCALIATLFLEWVDRHFADRRH